MLDPETIKKEYEQKHVLGAGGAGTVFCFAHRNTGHQIAIKVIFQALADSQVENYILRSTRLLQHLQHDNLVKFYCYYKSSQTEHRLVSEFLPGGDLDLAIAKQTVPPHLAGKWALQICSALSYLHSEGLTHRDVKPQNVLLTSRDLDEADAKLGGFDLMRERSMLVSPGVGSLSYQAPEMSQSEYSEKVDVWSLGCLVYKLLTRNKPFSVFSEEEMRREIAESEIPGQPLALNFVRRCLTFEPERRPSACELLSDPFLAAAGLFHSYCKQVSASIQQAYTMREMNALRGKTCADNGYRLAAENLEVMELLAETNRELKGTVEVMRARSMQLAETAEKLYEGYLVYS